MNLFLKKIEFSWAMESVDDPFFSYSGDTLKVYFMIFLGINDRNKDINNYLLSNDLHDELDMPDEEYNNSGYRIINFDFKTFDSFYCTDKKSGLINYFSDFEIDLGVYKEVDENNMLLGYIFVGNDLFLSVKAKEYKTSIGKVL